MPDGMHYPAHRQGKQGCMVPETLRFLALMAGTSLFAFVIVPAMELRPERTLVIAEMLAVLAFGTWLGGKIYEPGRNRRK